MKQWWIKHFPNHEREPGEREILCEILAEVRAIRAILSPKISGLAIESEGAFEVTLTAKAVWSDGFKGFDASHVEPTGWAVAFAETSGDAVIQDNGDGTATVSAGDAASVITATEAALSLSATFDVAALTVTGLEIEQS